jgi:hypothetical protein
VIALGDSDANEPAISADSLVVSEISDELTSAVLLDVQAASRIEPPSRNNELGVRI